MPICRRYVTYDETDIHIDRQLRKLRVNEHTCRHVLESNIVLLGGLALQLDRLWYEKHA